MRISPVFLPTIGILLGFVLIGMVYEGLGVEDYLAAVIPSQGALEEKIRQMTGAATANLGAGQGVEPADVPVTSVAASYVRWAALFGALLTAWAVLASVAIEAIWRLRGRVARNSTAANLLWIVLPTVAIAGAVLDVSGCLVNRSVGDAAQTPGFSGIRNFAGWLAGCLVVIAQSHILAKPYGTITDRRARARALADDVRSMKMLLFATTFSLAIGVAQISTLTRLSLVVRLSNVSEAPVTLTPYLQDLEQSFTLGAATLFTIIAVLAFLPAMAVLETGRVRLLGDLTRDVKSKADPDAEAVDTLKRSMWSYAVDSGAFLLPLVSGLAVTRLW